MRTIVFLLALAFTLDAAAVTVDNDSGCDIAVLPAATLLLPYFEVDLDSPNGETTLFTVTNVTNVDQIAQVTLWTDHAFPVIVFPMYLTGYDVQSINLFDIIERGSIAPDRGTGTDVRPRGTYSSANAALDLSDCDRLPGILDATYVHRMQDAFTGGFVRALGNIAPACENIGGVHKNAVGYVTIDVVGACKPLYALDETYWTELIRYDNALIGDYQQLNSLENSAQGGPMVHIRAVPEGGTPELRTRLVQYDAEFDRTFYSRFQPAATPRLDGRQPLPAQFATRWIQGGTATGSTSLKVWREGATGRNAACATFAENGDLDVREVVVFDEDENATAGLPVELPATSRTSVSESALYPQTANNAVSGWMYLNLDRPGDAFAAQGWVISSMRALGRFSTDTDAQALGNGCSEPVRLSEVTRQFGEQIGPAPNNNGNDDDEVSTQNDDTCDIAAMPAATLLLPRFEVDLEDRSGETTLFTVTNVTAEDQIARVTLWTDYAYPVYTFNLPLTGYDVQSISLFDVLGRGVIGSTVPPRGPYSDRNRDISLGACDQGPGALDPALIALLQDAFTRGITTGCNTIGSQHENAVGYATIDVVRNCSSITPTDDDYWTSDLSHENVLVGDYQQVHLASNAARSAELVHIRAIPEGDGGDDHTPFARTFYSRFQRASSPRADGRQPLPTTFAARWITGSVHAFATAFEIWRETTRGSATTCSTHPDNVAGIVEAVAFDESENAFGMVPCTRCSPPFEWNSVLPATSRVASNDSSVFPQPTNGSIGGWMYMNLDADADDDDAHQNWVVSTMAAQGRFSVASHAPALGNGCSAPVGTSVVLNGSTVIGPAPNDN
jgi:hypothetical protein